MNSQKLKNSARALRSKGWSYREIHEYLMVAKSTCSIWCAEIVLNKKAATRLESLVREGRKKGQDSNHNRALRRDNKINEGASKALKTIGLNNTLKKLLCSMLYWAEGSKRQNRIVFTNSDPDMVKIFLKLLNESYSLDQNRFQASLHLHSYHDQQKQIKFWSDCTGIAKNKISVYNKISSGINKREGYPGCISIRYNDVNTSRDLEAYYKNFIPLYGGFV